MIQRVLGIMTLSALILLSALLQSTSPSTSHPVVILLVFLLLYLLVLGALTFFMFWIGKVIRHAVPAWRHRKELTIQDAYYYSTALALAPIVLIGVKSIGRSTIYDVLLIIVFEIIACFYIAKRRS